MTEYKNNIASKAIPYKTVNYIESTGTQYIDTRLKAPNGFECYVKFAYTGYSSQPYIIGSHNTSAPYGRNGLYIEDINLPLSFGLGTGDTYHLDRSQYPTTGQAYDIHFSTIKGNSYLEVNGNKDIETDDSSVRSANSIWLGWSQYLKALNLPTAKMRFYNVKMLIDGKIAFDAIPVEVDGEGCMFDATTDKLFKNGGTGKFLIGD